MGFLSRLFGRKKPSPAMPLEAFLRQFADDPDLADRMIRDKKPETRLTMALCFACLYGGYTLTVQIRESLASLPHLGGSTSSDPFPFDAVAQETIAFILYTAMAEHLNNADEEDDDDDDDDDESNERPKNEKFEALKGATYLADLLAARYIENRPKDYFRSRQLCYSLDNHKGKNLFEEAAKQVLKVLPPSVGPESLEDMFQFVAIQHVLASDILLSTKKGVDDLYLAWEVNPQIFGPYDRR